MALLSQVSLSATVPPRVRPSKSQGAARRCGHAQYGPGNPQVLRARRELCLQSKRRDYRGSARRLPANGTESVEARPQLRGGRNIRVSHSRALNRQLLTRNASLRHHQCGIRLEQGGFARTASQPTTPFWHFCVEQANLLQMCTAQFRVTLKSKTNADPMMIAGQKAFANSFILVSLHSPTHVGFLRPRRRRVTMSVSASMKLKFASILIVPTMRNPSQRTADSSFGFSTLR
jgi:hypothetical protein